MKKFYLSILLLAGFSAYAQDKAICASTFDSFSLASESYWDGSDQTGGFDDDCLYWHFNNFYDTAFGGFWSAGWVYSNMTDVATAGNQFSSFVGDDFTGGGNYLCGTTFSSELGIQPAPAWVPGGSDISFYVSNSTYTAISMRDGDFFGKVFGDSVDANGVVDGTNGEDWCKLTVYGFYLGSLIDSQEVYLADYRFSNDSMDYILDTWEQVSFTGQFIDSLNFVMTSSDVGAAGMNTPAFFCFDHMSGDYATDIAEEEIVELNVYPNPTTDYVVLSIDQPAMLSIYNMQGALVRNEIVRPNQQLDVAALAAGPYQLVLTQDQVRKQARLIKR